MELTPEGTGYAVGTVLETKEETNVDWAEFKMPQYLRLEVDRKEAIAHGCNDKCSKTEPDGRDA